jgi:hypothetical protein
MDNFQPQAGELHLRGGHEEGDFKIHGIVLFVVILVLSAILTFLVAWALMRLFEWGERTYIDKPATPVQQQLGQQRGELVGKQGVRPQPDWYNRAVDARVLDKTFAAPRLQDDDASDMGAFRKAEEDWLRETGKNPDGSVHISIDRAIDLLAKSGLPPVNGTFKPMPQLAPLEAEAEAARRRVSESGAQPQQPMKQKQ